MDNIKKLVEEIPYLQLPKEEYDPSEEEEDTLEHIETDHKGRGCTFLWTDI